MWAVGCLSLSHVVVILCFPVEGHLCVDCHAFEFMERALTAMQSSTEGLITRVSFLCLKCQTHALRLNGLAAIKN
uniref:Secreted protein n=1 Tax=Eptatretus burgeri TaxID=7764 RepID=A0A8C4QVN5_EPTBU